MDLKRSLYTSTPKTPGTREYRQPVYRDYPANAVPVTGVFTLTADEAVYILDVAEKAKRYHFDEIKLMDARCVWLRHEPSAAGAFVEKRSRTVTGGIMVSVTSVRIEGREEHSDVLLFTLPMSLDDLVRDFALVPRPTDARKAA